MYPGGTAIGGPENHAVRILIAHRGAGVRIRKRNTVQIIECDCRLAVPSLSAISCLKNDASVADNSSRVRIGECYRVETVRALRKRVVGLLNPVVPSVGCSENYTGAAQFESANRSIIRIGERNAIKSFGRSACLRLPAVASISRSENQASIADSGSGIGVGKRNFEKTYRSWVYLAIPVLSSIGCSENGAFSPDSA